MKTAASHHSTRHGFILWFFSTVVMILMAGGIPCRAEDAAGRLIHSTGGILYSPDGGKSWSAAERSMAFPEGTCIRVAPDGEAALLLRDRSQIRLRSGAVLCLKKAGSSPGKTPAESGIYNLLNGMLWFRNKRRGPKPLFETPVVTAAIRGTEMAIAVDEAGDTEVTILEGRVRCANDFGDAVVGRGQGVKVEPGRAPVILTLVRPEDAVQWLLLTPDIMGPADKENVPSPDAAGIELAKQAIRSLVRGQRERALKEAEEAVQTAPERAAPRVALATVLQSMGRFKAAAKEGIRGLELDPASVPALVRTLELLLGLDRIDEARQRIAVFRGEADPRIDLLSGHLALIRFDTETARAAFQRAVDRQGDLAPAYLGLGLALYRQGKTDEALENMEKASLFDPLAAYPHNYLAKALYELGEREEAELELRRASVLDPNDPTPYLYLATMLTDRYRPGEGIQALEKSLALNDNRLMTRSRYLLDQDRAIKNVSLAWSLARMGLHTWARARGDRAVWEDPTNSGAYLFRASESIGLRQVDTATLADIRRARLLQPVNANTYITYTDYQSLLELPALNSTVTGEIGADESGVAVGNLRGGNERIAFFAEAGYATTDGPEDGTGKWSGQGLGRAKGTPIPGHELTAEAIMGRIEEEDLRPWQDGALIPKDRESITEFWSGNLGYHWKQQPGRDFLFLLQVGEKELSGKQIDTSQRVFMNNPVLESIRLNQNADERLRRAEAIEFFRLGDHRLSFGGAAQDTEDSSDATFIRSFDQPGLIGNTFTFHSPENHRGELRLYFRDLWFVSPGVNFDVGLEWVRLDDIWRNPDGSFRPKEDILPQVGAVWRISGKDTLRTAFFRELQPDFISGTLQPTEVAGFARVTGTFHGTWTEFYGFGWDRQWNPRMFTRSEFFYRKREYPGTFSPHPAGESWKDERVQGFRLIGEGLLTDQWALALGFRFMDFQIEDPTRKRLDYDLSARLTWVHPSGFRFQSALWYVNQDERSGFENPMGDHFAIASISAEKSVFDKNGLIFFRWENIFNETFSYLAMEPTEVDQLPWQASLWVAGFQWNF